MPSSGSFNHSCLPCSKGKYEDQVARTTCKLCPEGRWSGATKLTTDSSCTKCPAGTYSKAKGADSVNMCIECPGGTYGDVLGAATIKNTCKDCSAGRHRPYGALSKCIDCNVGYYQDKTSQASCLPCIPAKYQSETGATTCKACAKNYFTDQTEQTTCKACPRGKGNNGDSSSCGACPAGKKIEAATQICLDCVAGRFQQDAGQKECDACPAGFSQQHKARASCLPCLPGEFQASASSTLCNLCSANTFTSSAGSILCKSCIAGEKAEPGSAKCTKCDAGEAGTGANGACEKCVVGRYRTSSQSATSCDACPRGRYQSETGATSCLPCIPGFHVDVLGATRCKACKEDTYSQQVSRAMSCDACGSGRTSKAGSTVCSSCSAGEKIDGHACVSCSAGFFTGSIDQPNCTPCAIGKTTKGSGASSCEQCGLGTYGSSDGVCDACPQGYYQDSFGSTDCLACPVDTYLTEAGKSSKAECQKCISAKPHTTTDGKEGIADPAHCICRGADSQDTKHPDGFYTSSAGICLACPEGADCFENGMIDTDLVASAGYWRAFSNSIEFTDCASAFKKSLDPVKDAQKRCPGGNFKKRAARRRLVESETEIRNTTFDANDQCQQTPSDGTMKAQAFGGPVCQSCRTDEYTGKKCGSCPEGASLSTMLSSMAVIMFVLYLLFVVIFMTAKVESDDEDDTEGQTEKKKRKGCCGSKSETLMRLENAALKGEQGMIEEMEREAEILEGKTHNKKKSPKVKKKKTKEERLKAARGSTAARRFVGDQMLLGRVTESSGGNATFRSDSQVIMDRVKIFYGWMQIFTSLTLTFEIAWPIQFRQLSLSFGFINFDLSNLLSESACQLSVSFLDKMMVHLLVPVWLLLMILLARAPAFWLRPQHRPKQQGLMIKMIASLALILYPGLCTRLFSSLKTVSVPGMISDTHSGVVLAVDYSVEAYGPVHQPYILITMIGIIVYVIGVPGVVLLALKCNKKYLYAGGTTEKEKKRHKQVVNSFGTLYLQCKSVIL